MYLDIHIVGPYPPPYGGVSTHVSRLRNRLIQDGHACSIWDRCRDLENGFHLLDKPNRSSLHQLLNVRQPSIFHFHSNHYLAGCLASKGRKVLFTVHNERINMTFNGKRWGRQSWHDWRTRTVFKKVPYFIAVSDKAKSELIRFGLESEKIVVIPAYLRPDETEQAPTQSSYDFNLFRKRKSLIMAVCATGLKFHHGVDLYGADMCIELLAQMKGKTSSLGLVIAVSIGGESEYLERLKARARALDVADDILWILEPGVFTPFLKQCDLFLRPTNTDGFSVSIAEALEYDVPVIASDIVARPEGCVTFQGRNQADLLNKAIYTFKSIEGLEQPRIESKVKDRYKDILDVYKAIHGVRAT